MKKLTSSPWQASEEPYKSLVQSWTAQLVYQILELTRAQVAPSVVYVGEKSPKPVAPVVHGARYVYVLRDGRDVVVSLLAHRVRIGGFVDWCDNDRMFGTDEAELAAVSRNWDFFERNPQQLLSDERCVRQVRAGRAPFCFSLLNSAFCLFLPSWRDIGGDVCRTT